MRPLEKPYTNNGRCRCSAINVVTPRHRVQQQQQLPVLSTLPPPCSIDTLAQNCSSKPASWFPSTPSEYQAYKAKLNASSDAAVLSSSIPHVPSQQISSSQLTTVNFVIPSLPLNLGLCRIPPLSSSHSHKQSPLSSSSSSTTTTTTTITTNSKCRRRISKSDIAEANWWIKMYESLVWHMQDQNVGDLSSHELAFLERLQTKVQRRWYPIAEKAAREQFKKKSSRQEHDDDDTSLGPSSLSSSRDSCALVSCSSGVSSVPVSISQGCIITMTNQTQAQPSSSQMDVDRPSLRLSPGTPPPPMLDPAQLAAQAILRRSQASQKPLRRKRFASPGCSALRREITLVA